LAKLRQSVVRVIDGVLATVRRDRRVTPRPRPPALCHATLIAHGVTGHDQADLARHYGQGAWLLFLTAFSAARVVTRTDRSDAAEHMLDHDPLVR
jgi:hypothetical protein